MGSRPAHNRWVAAQDIGSGRREPASPREVSVLTQARAQAGRALQFLRTTEQRSARSRGALAQDTVLALVATVAVLIMIHKLALQPAGTIAPGQPADQNIADGSGAVAMVAGALTTLPLAVRRIFPLTAFWVILAAATATPHYAANLVSLAAVVLAAFSGMAYSRFRGAAVLSMPAAAFLDLKYLHASQLTSLRHGGTVIVVAFPVLVLGNTIHQWRRQVVDAKAQLRRLQAEHETATQQALKQERQRIASELHDVVTHNVSVMIVQAGAARQVLTAAPDEARAALLAVEASGRAAMAELRHLLGLLSPAEGGADESAGHSALTGEGLQPQPGLGQLESLVGRVRAAGLPVELRVGEVPLVPPGLDLAAYRVVQEALTNVLKHAGRPATTVTVEDRGGDLVVEVADAGRPGGASRLAQVPGPAADGGRGLLGLRERIGLYGGELSSGPEPDGGWRVSARLPVDQAQGPAARPPIRQAS